MRPASRNPESAQTLPHVKPLKKHTPKRKKKKKISNEATLKISRVIKRDTQIIILKKPKIMVKSCVGFSGKRYT